jgi:hypothetical protein
MFFDDHKRAATLIRGKRDAKGNRMAEPTPMKPEISKTEDGEMDGRHSAMQDFMAAHREGSAQKMSEAMANFIDIHHSMPMTEPSDSPASES